MNNNQNQNNNENEENEQPVLEQLPFNLGNISNNDQSINNNNNNDNNIGFFDYITPPEVVEIGNSIIPSTIFVSINNIR